MKKIVLLLAACLFCSAQIAEAQLIRSSQTVITKTKKEKVKKEKKVLAPVKAGLQQEFSVEAGAGGDMDLAYGANYTIGYRFNNTLFIGGGFGLGHGEADNIYEYYWRDEIFTIRKNYHTYRCITEEHEYLASLKSFYAQFFGNVRVYLTKTRVQPYFDLSFGGIYMKQKTEGYHDLYHGPLTFDSYEELSRTYADINNNWDMQDYTGKKEFSMFAAPQFGINWRLGNRCSLNFAVGYKWFSAYDVVSGYPQAKIGFTF